MRSRTNLQPSVALLAASLLGAAACHGSKSAKVDSAAGDAVLVRTAPVVTAALAEPVRATGTLSPKEEMRLSFKIPGVLGNILVNESDQVRAGEPLATLDLAEIDAEVSAAQSASTQADRDLARARGLVRDSIAPVAQLEAAETRASVARAALQTAQFNRRYATIVAPSAGTVLRKLAETREVVAPGAPILTFRPAETSIVLRAGLADRDAVRVRVGDVASVHFDAYPGTDFSGRVTQLAPSATASSGAYQVEVRLDGARQLPLGLIGSLEIRPSRTQSYRVVPIESVIEGDGDQASVFAVVDGGRSVKRRLVTVAFVHGGQVAVRGGLDGVSSVVTDGSAYLTDGAPVKIASVAQAGSER